MHAKTTAREKGKRYTQLLLAAMNPRRVELLQQLADYFGSMQTSCHKELVKANQEAQAEWVTYGFFSWYGIQQLDFLFFSTIVGGFNDAIQTAMDKAQIMRSLNGITRLSDAAIQKELPSPLNTITTQSLVQNTLVSSLEGKKTVQSSGEVMATLPPSSMGMSSMYSKLAYFPVLSGLQVPRSDLSMSESSVVPENSSVSAADSIKVVARSTSTAPGNHPAKFYAHPVARTPAARISIPQRSNSYSDRALVQSFGLPASLLNDPTLSQSRKPSSSGISTSEKRRGRPPKASSAADLGAMASHNFSTSNRTPGTMAQGSMMNSTSTDTALVAQRRTTPESSGVGVIFQLQHVQPGQATSSLRGPQSMANLVPHHHSMLQNMATGNHGTHNALANMIDSIASVRGASVGQNLHLNPPSHRKTLSNDSTSMRIGGKVGILSTTAKRMDDLAQTQNTSWQHSSTPLDSISRNSESPSTSKTAAQSLLQPPPFSYAGVQPSFYSHSNRSSIAPAIHSLSQDSGQNKVHGITTNADNDDLGSFSEPGFSNHTTSSFISMIPVQNLQDNISRPGNPKMISASQILQSMSCPSQTPLDSQSAKMQSCEPPTSFSLVTPPSQLHEVVPNLPDTISSSVVTEFDVHGHPSIPEAK